MPKEFSGDKKLPLKTVSQLIADGKKLPKIEALKWEKGQGARQTAYLCYSSGTSGLPVSKNAVIGTRPNLGLKEKNLTFPISERRHDQPS
jgi:hypothetical protein